MKVDRRKAIKFTVVAMGGVILSGAMCRPSGPRDPHLHRDVCAHCRMSISELRFASQLVGPGTEVKFYDDIGCALWHRHRNPDLKNGVLYVRHPQEERWVLAHEISYRKGFRTPMDFGYGPVMESDGPDLMDLEGVEKALVQNAAMAPQDRN